METVMYIGFTDPIVFAPSSALSHRSIYNSCGEICI
jgi:hypothetical protein